jgi:S-adenosylmethionine:tRNA ribosyltransferase-isomerase
MLAATTASASQACNTPPGPRWFERPRSLQAEVPPEWRGIARDGVRLLVSDDRGHRHVRFRELADELLPGDVLVVNTSATLPASLPARGRVGEFTLNLCTRYGRRLWLAEPRRSAREPGALPLRAGDRFVAGGASGRMVAPYAAAPRLWFVAFDGDVEEAMARRGEPIRYAYVTAQLPLAAYQTVFARVPGSAEMPSAARPFTHALLSRIASRGVRIARVLLHTGVSSLELAPGEDVARIAYPEPFEVGHAAAQLVNRARAAGHRVVAVGTTVVRALESAAEQGVVRPAKGFTRLILEPRRGVHVVDGLITGLHDPNTSHLAMLLAIGGEARVWSGYAQAVRERYLWHEFGDAHLLWKPGRAPHHERAGENVDAAGFSCADRSSAA